jgi:hypothetical protein
MVERPSFVFSGIWDFNGLARRCVNYTVAQALRRIDIFHYRLETETFECVDPSRLQEFANNPVRLLERPLKDGDTQRSRAGRGGECMGKSRARDAGADDEDVVAVGHVLIFQVERDDTFYAIRSAPDRPSYDLQFSPPVSPEQSRQLQSLQIFCLANGVLNVSQNGCSELFGSSTMV